MKTKIFDPADGFGLLTDLSEITDATLVKRGDRWWMFAAGQIKGISETDLFSASLPDKAPLSASGWILTPDEKDPKKIAKIAGRGFSGSWDLKGGRHCPAYVKAGIHSWVFGWSEFIMLVLLKICGGHIQSDILNGMEIPGLIRQNQPLSPLSSGNAEACTSQTLYMQMGNGSFGMLPALTWIIILYTICRK